MEDGIGSEEVLEGGGLAGRPGGWPSVLASDRKPVFVYTLTTQ